MIYKALFKIKTQEIPRFLLAVKKARAWWRVLSNYLNMTRTVQLNCPIKANQIWEFCYSYDNNNSNNNNNNNDKSLIVLSIPSGSCHQMLFRIYPKEYLLHWQTFIACKLKGFWLNGPIRFLSYKDLPYSSNVWNNAPQRTSSNFPMNTLT